jgi:hypothetical protein
MFNYYILTFLNFYLFYFQLECHKSNKENKMHE